MAIQTQRHSHFQNAVQDMMKPFTEPNDARNADRAFGYFGASCVLGGVVGTIALGGNPGPIAVGIVFAALSTLPFCYEKAMDFANRHFACATKEDSASVENGEGWQAIALQTMKSESRTTAAAPKDRDEVVDRANQPGTSHWVENQPGNSLYVESMLV